MSKSTEVAVLLSGSGRTLQNLIDRIAEGALPVRIAVVVSSKPGVKGLERAKKAGIPNHVVDRKQYPDNQAHSEAINKILMDYHVDLICLCGYMHLYYFAEEMRGRVMNIHPALIPAFCGKGYYGHHVHEAVAESGVKVSGCTVHFVDEQYDHGPIIVQKTVPIFAEDSPDDIADRVFEAECKAYPKAIRLFAEGRLRIEGRKVFVLEDN